ncbi:MAG: hypothetical protein ACP6IY_05290 [Promethearchaeia archaeon]
MKLDDIDKQIINELYKDGRASLTTLKERIFKEDHQSTMSHTGIKKRIQKLKDNDLIKVQANVNISALNYKACFIMLEMKNYEAIKEIIDAYSSCPRVFLLCHISGQYNLIMGIIGQNIDVLHRYINYCGPTNKEGILHSQILFVSDFIIPKYTPINLFNKESQEAKCGNICRECEAFLDGSCDGCGNF